jgi:micrococcal nuclease
MQLNAKEQTIIRTGYEVVKIVDGDGLIVRNIFTKKEEEIRLYGIDAPEITLCVKLKQDERETHIPASLLMTLGYRSYNFLKELVLHGTIVTIVQEESNLIDKYGRTLAYIILPDGRTINEILLEEGFVKPYDKIYCEKLPIYQDIYLKAKGRKKGLFKDVLNF